MVVKSKAWLYKYRILLKYKIILDNAVILIMGIYVEK